MSTEPRVPAKAEKIKKAYQSPRLIEYGDIRAVTHAVGQSGKKDGGGGKIQKTA